MNALLNIAGLVTPVALTLSEQSHASMSKPSTMVEIGIGMAGSDGATLGGNPPAITLWSGNKGHLGQYVPSGKSAKSIMQPGSAWTQNIDRPDGASGQPEYMMLSAYENKGFCMNHISVSGSGINWAWTGDNGYACGADWYPSTAKNGPANFQPKCVWIDKDHSNKLRFIGMSLHMPDFSGNAAMAQQYNADRATMCNAKARFFMWGKYDQNPGWAQQPIFFTPPLEYTQDGADLDPKRIFKEGYTDPIQTGMQDAGTHQRRSGPDDSGDSHPGHVVVSDYREHSAREVCDSSTSRGPSFVSTTEGLYCNMGTKEAHPLCSDTIKEDCYDLEQHHLVGRRLHSRDLAPQVHKRYENVHRWTPEA